MPAANSKSGVLAQQIHDEFLTCKICLEGFTNPKSLDCLHTFCEDCIENHANSESSYKKYSDYREFTCPLCRKRTTLPLGGVKKLPDNFLVSSLTEVVDRQKPSKFQVCDFCKLVNRKHREASAKCLDCSKLLCKDCVEQHNDTKVTKDHNIFDIEIEKDIDCKEHPEEVIRFYCETCEDPVCIICTFNDHKDHDVTQFSDAVTKYKSNIQNLMNDCQSNLVKCESQIQSLEQCEKCIKQAETKIRDISIDMIADIRNREKILIEEIHNLYGPDVIEMIAKKENTERDIETLKSTVQLTELIIKGKDMELLLLQKEIQEKLQTFSQSGVMKELPKTVNKVIHFVPGMLDMGYIHDADRPLLSQTRHRFSHQGTESEDNFDPSDFFETVATQTESASVKRVEVATNTSIVVGCDGVTQTDEPPMNGYRADAYNEFDGETENEAVSRRRRRRREREKAVEAETLNERQSRRGDRYSSCYDVE
ncbi:E3 ubiquitin-protein ligase TRIM56-like isoform X2 [Watersipora subatra]